MWAFWVPVGEAQSLKGQLQTALREPQGDPTLPVHSGGKQECTQLAQEKYFSLQVSSVFPRFFFLTEIFYGV